MVEAVADAEKKLADIKASEYISRGYEIERNCELDFLPGFAADIVARRGNETRVIEVKTRSSLRLLPQVHELARILRGMPDWSFDLVVVGEPDILEPPKGMQMVVKEAIDLRIKKAEAVLSSGYAEAAFILAWSACEAALRDALDPREDDRQRITPTHHLLERAGFEGTIDRADYLHLVDSMKIRNALVHGFGIEEIEDRQVIDLLKVARRLLTDI